MRLMNLERLSDVPQRHGIRLMLQFGSSVTGHLRPDGDFDLAVLLDPLPGSLAEELDLLADLQDLVKEHEVDIAIINRTDPLFLKQIVEHKSAVVWFAAASRRSWSDGAFAARIARGLAPQPDCARV